MYVTGVTSVGARAAAAGLIHLAQGINYAETDLSRTQPKYT
jgi:hypothetical protein